jgi:hypothetical protein
MVLVLKWQGYVSYVMLRKGEIRRRGRRKRKGQRNIRMSKYCIRIMEGNKGTKVSNRFYFTF